MKDPNLPPMLTLWRYKPSRRIVVRGGIWFVIKILFTGPLKALADECLSGSAVTRYEVEFPTLAGGYRLEEDGALCEWLKQTYEKMNRPWRPGTFKSHSDANLLRQAGCSPVILGPGLPARAHTRDEAVDFEQVVAAADLYRELLLISGR